MHQNLKNKLKCNKSNLKNKLALHLQLQVDIYVLQKHDLSVILRKPLSCCI